MIGFISPTNIMITHFNNYTPMQLINDKEIMIMKIIQHLTIDLQQNLYKILDITIEDDLVLNELDHDITFTILKNYRIDPTTIKQWLAAENVEYQ